MSARVRMYTTTICPYCIRAKSLLKGKGVEFEEINVSGDDVTRDWLVKATGGRRTVPADLHQRRAHRRLRRHARAGSRRRAGQEARRLGRRVGSRAFSA